jgi:site-specific DNA recombinase
MRSYFDLDCLGAKVICLDGTEDLPRAVLEAWPRLQAQQDPGERVRDAMRRKAIKGEVLGRAPYGYKPGPRRRLQIVPAEAAVVRYIFRLYLRDGLGIRLIARRLNEENFRTRRGSLWSMVGVRDILRNRVYLGTYSRLGVRVPYSHPAIISQDDFRRVQERLNSRRPSSTSRQTAVFLLSGLLYCGSCGNKMTGVTRRQRWLRNGDGNERSAMYRYYQCQSRINQSVCNYHTHRAADLEEAVRQALLGQRGTVVEAMPQAGHAEAALREAQKRCEQLKTKLTRLEKRLEAYLQAAAAGRVTYERLRNLGTSVAEQRLTLMESLEEAQQLAQRQMTAAERQKRRAEALNQLTNEWDYMTPQQRQVLLRELVDRISTQDQDIKIVLSH